MGELRPNTTAPVTGEPAGAPPGAAALRSHPLALVDGCYRTPQRRVGLLARTFPSTVFFVRFFATVCRAARQAKAGRYSSAAWSDSSLEVLRTLESVGCRFEISGVQHLAEVAGPCVIVGNHMSTLETAVLPTVIQPLREVTFVVKQSLVDYPIFKHVMRSRDPIAISQTNPREDLRTMLDGGLERLARGVSLVVFPEGSRRTAFDPALFNTIGAKLASRANVPLLPVALETSAWGLGKPIADLGRIDPRRPVRFAFGAPVHVSGRGADAHQAILAFIEERLESWRAEDAARSGPGASLGL